MPRPASWRATSWTIASAPRRPWWAASCSCGASASCTASRKRPDQRADGPSRLQVVSSFAGAPFGEWRYGEQPVTAPPIPQSASLLSIMLSLRSILPPASQRASAAGVLLTLLAGGLQAQEVRYLVAGRFEAAAGQELTVSFARRGATSVDELERAPWPAGFAHALVRAGGGQRNLAAFAPDRPGEDFVQLALEAPDVTLIASDPTPTVEALSATDLALFIAAHIPTERLPADWRARLSSGSMRVRRLESQKVLVRVVGAEGWMPNSSTAQSKTGQPVELRPLADPTSASLHSDLPLRAYLPAGSKRGARVIATHVATGRRQSFLTDREGTGFFTVTAAGVWTVEVHHARPLEGEERERFEADWELSSATLTFEAPHWDPRQAGALPDPQRAERQAAGERRQDR